MDSAILPAYPSIGIHSDHIGMTKFGSEEDPGFEDFQTELLRIVEKARDEKGTPDNGNDLDPTVLKDIPNAAEPPVSKTGDGNRGTVHLGNNHQSNALYGGTQTFHGDVRFGGSN